MTLAVIIILSLACIGLVFLALHLNGKYVAYRNNYMSAYDDLNSTGASLMNTIDRVKALQAELSAAKSAGNLAKSLSAEQDAIVEWCQQNGITFHPDGGPFSEQIIHLLVNQADMIGGVLQQRNELMKFVEKLAEGQAFIPYYEIQQTALELVAKAKGGAA